MTQANDAQLGANKRVGSGPIGFTLLLPRGEEIGSSRLTPGPGVAVVRRGALAMRSQHGLHAAAQLLLADDVLAVDDGSDDIALRGSSRMTALLDTRVLVVPHPPAVLAARWPKVAAELMTAMDAQLRRGSMQQHVSQLPRVEDRVISLLALLGQGLGRVTPDGIRISLPGLHHALIGEMVGARRPTVTTAIGHLERTGRLVRAKDGYVLPHRSHAGSHPVIPVDRSTDGPTEPTYQDPAAPHGAPAPPTEPAGRATQTTLRSPSCAA